MGFLCDGVDSPIDKKPLNEEQFLTLTLKLIGSFL